MAEGQQAGSVSTADMYCLFAGAIDQLAVQRFHNIIAMSGAAKIGHVHILFQTSGGTVSDGVSLYNLFRGCPIEITLYNVGAVCSAGVIAYLGAKNRCVSAYGSFMIHRSYLSPIAATSDRLTAAAGQTLIDDERTENILRSAASKIPQDKWEMHKFADVWISATEAVSYGIATAVREFATPMGRQLFNVWPPQN